MAVRKNGQQQDQPQGRNVEGTADRACVSVKPLGKKGLQKKPRQYTSLKREKLIKNLLFNKFKTLKAAMLDAGYSENTANDQTAEVLGNPRVRTTIREAMEKEGVDENRLTKIISEGLEATKVISAMAAASSGEGMKNAGGMSKDFIEVPDFLARHKFLQTALDLRGDYPDKKIDVNQPFETHEQRLARLKGQT